MKTKSNTYLSIFFTALAFFLFPQHIAYADVASILYIQGSGGSVLANTSLTVPEACSVQDSGGVSHSFSGHKAICALQAAKNNGIIASFAVTDWGFGFSLDNINGIANAPDWSTLWQLWQNGTSASVGIQGIVLAQGDSFQLTYGPWPTEIIRAPQVSGGGGGVPAYVHDTLNVQAAVSFLLSLQNKDGSFGSSPLLSDWAALALSSYSSPETERAKDALRNHLIGDLSVGTLLTDYERRVMALMALGVNPYFGTSTNYIQKIINGFDGKQFGSSDLANDDIFALLVLVKAGYQSFDAEIAKTITFVLSSQESNGSFGSVDMTAAAIQALALVSGAEGVSSSLKNARAYLQEQQKDSGAFGNVYATSWAMQAIATLGESEVSWIKGVNTPGDYLYSQQAEDGGVEKGDVNNNRIWATAYAIPAALGKSWGSVLGQFQKSLVSPVAEEILEAPKELQFQLDAIAQEVQVLTLKVVELELQDVTAQVAVLEPRVLAFVESQARGLALVPQTPEQVVITAELIEPEGSSEPERPVVASSQLSASPEPEPRTRTSSVRGRQVRYGASVGEAVRTQPFVASAPQGLRLPWQDLLPYIVGGGVLLFLLFGNPNVVLSFLRGKLKLTP